MRPGKFSFSQAHKTAGFSILEQAMVLPVVLLMLGLAFDGNTLLQARSALKQAINSTLRTCYTTDGKCIKAAISTSSPALYNYYKGSNTNNNTNLTKMVQFAGSGSYFSYPTVQYSNFGADFLGQGQADATVSSFAASGGWKWGEVQQRYVEMTSTLPYLAGSVARKLTATYSDYSSAYPELSNTTHHIEGIEIRPTHWQPSDADSAADYWTELATFSVSAPFPGVPCYTRNSKHKLVACNGSDPLKRESSSSIALAVKGQAIKIFNDLTDQSLVDGEVEMRLVWDTNHSKDLGGQQLSVAGTEPKATHLTEFPFFTRGVPKDQVEHYKEFIAHGYKEFDLYQSIEIEHGKTYSLQFRARKTANTKNSFKFSLESVKIYGASFNEISKSIECPNKIPLNADTQNYNCDVSGSFLKATIVPNSIRFLSEALPNIPLSDAYSISAAQSELTSKVSAANLPAYQVSITSQHSQTFSSTCPTTPCLGSISQRGADGFVRDMTIGSSFCPISLPQAAIDAGVVSNYRWTIQHKALDKSPLVFKKDSCLKTEPTTPAQLDTSLSQCPGLTWSSTKSSAMLYTGTEGSVKPENDPHNPDYLKAHDSRYSCSDLQIVKQTYDSSRKDLPETINTLFGGDRVNKDSCDWTVVRSQLRQDAQKLGMPTGAFFQMALPKYVNEAELSAPPADPCAEYRLGSKNSVDQEDLVAGGPFPEGFVPAACGLQGSLCRRELAKSSERSEPGAETEFYADSGIQSGYEALSSSLPWTKAGCEESGCSKITLEKNTQNILTANAQVRVPLTFLGKIVPSLKDVTLNATGSERWEGQFAKDVR